MTDLTQASQRTSFKPSSSSFWSKIPSLPGVYIFEDKDKKPLYIGKSINLKSRLHQHLKASKVLATKQAHFVDQTKFLNFTVAVNDLIATLLETQLIKIYTPYYNSITKDDKSLSYIVITNPPDNRIQIVRGQDLKLNYFTNPHTQVFGPFTTKLYAQKILQQIRHLFGYCQRPQNSQHQACFYYHLHQCPGICHGDITSKQYQAHLTKIKKFLSGQIKTLTQSLERDINRQAKKQNFEQAERLKQTLLNLQLLNQTPHTSQFLKLPSQNSKLLQKLQTTLDHPLLKTPPQRIECYDAAHLQTTHYTGGMSVLTNGSLDPSQYRLFKIKTAKNDYDALKEMVTRRLSHSDWPQPDLILLDGGVGQLSSVFPIIPDHIACLAISKKKETLHYYDVDGKLVNLNLPISSPVLNLLRLLRDESHRLATSFHTKSRKKGLIN